MDNEKVSLRSVKLEGIHKRYDLDIGFHKSLNVLHGQNGTGKSTLIHIIANVANCDFIRFAFLDFEKITVSYSNNSIITITQHELDDEKTIKVEANDDRIEFSKRKAIETAREMEDSNPFIDFDPTLIENIKEFVERNKLRHLDTSYFPAFRTMLEAWSSQREHKERRPNRRKLVIEESTSFSRNLFGQFLPKINFPSPIDIENNLRDEIRDAQISIARYESSVFSGSFVKVFSALLNGGGSDLDTDQLLNQISQLSGANNSSKLGNIEGNSNTYRELQELVTRSSKSGADLASSAAGALAVYRDALAERQEFQQEAFKAIDNYFEVVNSFLDKKELSYELDRYRRVPRVGLRFPDGTWSSIRVMSSGERQLLTMLYAVNKMSGNSVVLIDEPELSLHIDWQEDLLGKMMEQLGNRQIIVCTHSPSIAEDFDEYMKEVVPVFRDHSTLQISSSEDDEEEQI